MPSTFPRLNDLTNEQIESLRLSIANGRKPTNRTCLHCGAIKLMKIGQKFCSTNCRMAHHSEAKDLLIETLNLRVAELSEELSLLRAKHV